MEKLKNLSKGQKIGIIVAIVVVLLLVIVLPIALSKKGGDSGTSTGSGTQQPSTPPAPSVEYLGCKADCVSHPPVGDRAADRALGYYKGDLTFEACKDLARAEGFKYFGLQFHEGVNGGDLETGQCFVDSSLQYDTPQEGSASAPCVTNAAGNAMGSGCSNATYEWKNLPAAEHARNHAAMFDSAQEKFLDNMAWNPNAPRLTWKSPMSLVDRSSVAAQGM